MPSCAITSSVWSRDFIAQRLRRQRGPPPGAARIRRDRSGQGSVPRRARHAVGRRDRCRTCATACAASARIPDSPPSRSLTLAIGVGANLAIFNVFDALLLRPLPVPNASELVTMTRWNGDNSGEQFLVSANSATGRSHRLVCVAVRHRQRDGVCRSRRRARARRCGVGQRQVLRHACD